MFERTIRNSALAAWLFIFHFVLASLAGAGEKALLAHWDFDEGNGDVVHDRSGNEHHGKIVNATWVKTKDGHALKFGESGSYVDFGKCPDLDITGEATIIAWVKPMASHFKTRMTNYEILSCESYPNSGYIIRLCGTSSRPYYRASHSKQVNSMSYYYARDPLENHTFHHVALVITKNPTKDRRYEYKGTFYLDGVSDNGMLLYNSPAAADATFTVSGKRQSFEGLIDDVRIYGRALSTGEILDMYKHGAASRGKDTSWFGHIVLKPFFRFNDGEIFVRADFRGIRPPEKGDTVSLQLGRPGEKPLQILPLESVPASGIAEMTFPFQQPDPGKYEIRALVVNNGKVRDRASLSFQSPPPAPKVADPARETIPALPPPRPPARYQVEVTKEGGFTVTLKGRTYPVSSSFSYPDGGENVLSASKRGKKSESAWRVKVTPTGKDNYRVLGEGKFYTIDRRIRLHPNRISVKDTVTVKHGEAVGIIFSHKIGSVEEAFLGGYVASGDIPKTTLHRNPTVFAVDRGLGLGMAALDNIFIIQSSGAYTGNEACLGSDEFALDTGASYTLEWAVYPFETGDYYDFINQVRKDEGRNNVTVEGMLTFRHIHQPVPTREWARIRNVKYLVGSVIMWPVDDPKVTLESSEFMKYPKEMAKIKSSYAKIRKRFPDMIFMFHYAPNIYATNKPKEEFPDSLIVDADGKQGMYSYPYHNYYYMKKERIDDNWRWWGFVPTLDNSYGKDMLKSVDVMMDEMDMNGVFVDGFLRGYGGMYTYNRWDGYTADIDPKTRTIVRKKGSTLILSHDLMVEFARRMIKKGGVVVGNSATVTRTLGRLPMLFDWEVIEGPYLHLNPTPCCLSRSGGGFKSEQEIVNDIHRKLQAGNLYFYYQTYDILKHRLAAAEMYPITVQEIHSNYIKGKERLVTALSGVYGWCNERHLHFTHFYDAGGREVPAGFLTTVDPSGVRTRVRLRDGKEMAIVKKIPVTLTAVAPVNLIAQQYDGNGIRLLLNGHGDVQLRVRSGDFALVPGATYRVEADTTQRVVASKGGELSISFTLDGPMTLRIGKEKQ